jgi:hypothetical protein
VTTPLEPPPKQEFDELETAKDFINLHTKDPIYALTKDRTGRFTKRGALCIEILWVRPFFSELQPEIRTQIQNCQYLPR